MDRPSFPPLTSLPKLTLSLPLSLNPSSCLFIIPLSELFSYIQSIFFSSHLCPFPPEFQHSQSVRHFPSSASHLSPHIPTPDAATMQGGEFYGRNSNLSHSWPGMAEGGVLRQVSFFKFLLRKLQSPQYTLDGYVGTNIHNFTKRCIGLLSKHWFGLLDTEECNKPTRFPKHTTVDNGVVNLKMTQKDKSHLPLRFVRLSCKNNEALFLEDNIQREAVHHRSPHPVVSARKNDLNDAENWYDFSDFCCNRSMHHL